MAILTSIALSQQRIARIKTFTNQTVSPKISNIYFILTNTIVASIPKLNCIPNLSILYLPVTVEPKLSTSETTSTPQYRFTSGRLHKNPNP